MDQQEKYFQSILNLNFVDRVQRQGHLSTLTELVNGLFLLLDHNYEQDSKFARSLTIRLVTSEKSSMNPSESKTTGAYVQEKVSTFLGFFRCAMKSSQTTFF